MYKRTLLSSVVFASFTVEYQYYVSCRFLSFLTKDVSKR
jgi:hypothetical protein